MDKYGHFNGGFHHDGDYFRPYASASIGKYLQPRFNSGSIGEESYADGDQLSFDERLMPQQRGMQKKDHILEKIYSKNWRYGHIFGDGLNFLLPTSDV